MICDLAWGLDHHKGELVMHKSVSLIATFLLLSCCAFAQTGGDVTGRVIDPSGSAVPGSVITLTNTATNATRQGVTTADGFYTFTSVPPGIYSLKTEHTGFKTMNTANIEVQVQQTVRVDMTLQIGQV